MAGLCSLNCFTVWNTSTTASAFSLSIRILTAQNTPVRPTPALLRDHIMGENQTRIGEGKGVEEISGAGEGRQNTVKKHSCR